MCIRDSFRAAAGDASGLRQWRLPVVLLGLRRWPAALLGPRWPLTAFLRRHCPPLAAVPRWYCQLLATFLRRHCSPLTAFPWRCVLPLSCGSAAHFSPLSRGNSAAFPRFPTAGRRAASPHFSPASGCAVSRRPPAWRPRRFPVSPTWQLRLPQFHLSSQLALPGWQISKLCPYIRHTGL